MRSWPCPNLPKIKILILPCLLNQRNCNCSTYWSSSIKMCFEIGDVQNFAHSNVCWCKNVLVVWVCVRRSLLHTPNSAPCALPGFQKFCSISPGHLIRSMLPKMNEKIKFSPKLTFKYPSISKLFNMHCFPTFLFFEVENWFLVCEIEFPNILISNDFFFFFDLGICNFGSTIVLANL